ncbi:MULTISPECIES: Uma2 family endonuclease [Nocardia]|uniref:Uma2 family endonuclease n=1 Tax=Nocardia TaxID=1817 RepID=UPI001E43D824|nr:MULTISPECIES: Uma2 family endonuclease [Nocardia]
MPPPDLDRLDLPGSMTWDELQQLPEVVSARIELWEGRVVWLRRGTPSHQFCANVFWTGLRRAAAEQRRNDPKEFSRAATETNIFFGATGKSDFMTPDFMVYRCQKSMHDDVRAADVLIAGEVLSPANSATEIEAKKARYATAGIPWYWEVDLNRDTDTPLIKAVRAYGRTTTPLELPTGVLSIRPVNYGLLNEWSPETGAGIVAKLPFPISIPWSEFNE